MFNIFKKPIAKVESKQPVVEASPANIETKEDDREAEVSRQRQRVAQQTYEKELRLASEGRWKPSDSRFSGDRFVSGTGYSVDAPGYFDELKARTYKALEYAFQQEVDQVERGVWSNSVFSNTRAGLCDEIEQYKISKYKELQGLVFQKRVEKQRAEFLEAGILREKEEMEALAEIEKKFEEEMILAKNGKWAGYPSYFQNSYLGLGPQSKVRVRKSECLRELQSVSARVFEEFITGKQASRNSREKEKVVSGKEVNQILGLLDDATDEEIKKAYKKFMMKNHPDRNPGGLDKDTQDKVTRLSNLWTNKNNPGHQEKREKR